MKRRPDYEHIAAMERELGLDDGVLDDTELITEIQEAVDARRVRARKDPNWVAPSERIPLLNARPHLVDLAERRRDLGNVMFYSGSAASMIPAVRIVRGPDAS